MASSDLSSLDELRKLANELNNTAMSYQPSIEGVDVDTRLKMIGQAEEIIRNLTDPSFLGYVYTARVGHSYPHVYSSDTNLIWYSLVHGIGCYANAPSSQGI